MKFKSRNKARRKAKSKGAWNLSKLFALKKEEKQDPFDEKVKCSSRKMYPCKKLKGEHDYKLVSKEDYDCDVFWMNYKGCKYYRCSGCGKKHIEFIEE